MNVNEFVDSVTGFDNLHGADKVRYVCWFLTVHGGLAVFGTRDVRKCFDDAGVPLPTNLSAYLRTMLDAEQLLKRGPQFQMSRKLKERLDRELGKREMTVTVEAALTELPGNLTVDYEKVYLDETLTCYRHGAFRATVVMAWNLAYDHLCNLILTRYLAEFNTQLPLTYPRADILVIAKRDDFTTLKESQVLQVAKSANIIAGSLHNVLKHNLEMRNNAAHATGVSISQHNAETVVLDLVNNVVLKLT
jgi:hypothetical protein